MLQKIVSRIADVPPACGCTQPLMASSILFVFENHRFKSVKACRPKARQAKVNEN
ncbi:MAG: hypothetical protein LBP59_14885 [Planctomycetaceae bacterium]|nr:hypothetical protein [Planctomycetaceae bacterium]